MPAGAVDGKYWIRVEYWSFEASNEANAEVTFYECTNTSSICAEKWEDIDRDNDCDAEDDPIADWWICLDTPFGDTYCQKTGLDGRVCWSGLAYGDYTVFEPALGGMVAVGPTTYDVTLDSDPVEVKFCNQQEPAAAQRSTWGVLKGMYR